MMSRKFSKRELVLVLILAVMLVFALYYLLVAKPSSDAIASANEKYETAQSDITIEAARATKLQEMRDALEEIGHGEGDDVEMPEYDNARALYSELDHALSQAKSSKVSPKPVTFNEDVATRQVQISFVGETYLAARSIIFEIYSCKYRNDIIAMTITPETSGHAGTGNVTVTLTINYYELVV